MAAHLTPIWSSPSTGNKRITPRFISLNITDDRADGSDEIELVVSDRDDGIVELPSSGDAIEVAVGWTAEPAGAPNRLLSSDVVGFPIG